MTPSVRTSLKVVAIACLIVCAIFVALSVPLYRQQYRLLQAWPRAEAVVVHSRVVAVPTAGAPLYDAEYTFAFEAHGRRAVVATAYSNHQSTSRERKQKQVARFPAGLRHTVLYNPADPSDIRMQPGYNVHFFAVPIFVSGAGAMFAVVALGLWVIARGRARAGREQTPVELDGVAQR
jgi:hypothetical protein